MKENQLLKAQLSEALSTIEALKKENSALSRRLSAFTTETKAPVSSQSSPDTSVCDLCGREIPSLNLEMHQIHCKKNFSKCPACNSLINSKELPEHMSSAAGSTADLIADVQAGNIENLESKLAHGANLRLATDDHMKNSLLHIAAASENTEIVAYLLTKGLDLNACNQYGETPLHLACSRNKNLSMVQMLVTRGADYLRRNAIGESALDLTQRCGFHEAFLYLSQLNTISRSFTAPANRPGTKRASRVNHS